MTSSDTIHTTTNANMTIRLSLRPQVKDAFTQTVADASTADASTQTVADASTQTDISLYIKEKNFFSQLQAFLQLYCLPIAFFCSSIFLIAMFILVIDCTLTILLKVSISNVFVVYLAFIASVITILCTIFCNLFPDFVYG